MKILSIAIVLAALLVVPTGATAKPDPSDKRAAKAECRTLRGHTDATREAFRTEFSSFLACVRAHAADEAREEHSAHTNAAKECKAERDADADAFRTKYGSEGHPNGRNAFGKCVSQKAREKEAAADEQDEQEATEFKNAAKECAAERSDPGFPAAHEGKSFEDFYGSNRNKRNAFGKCVSSKAPPYTDPLS